MTEKTLTEKIIEFLYDNPGASIKDVAQGLGISLNLARAILYRLKSKGIVGKSAYGYVLTDIGESIAKKIMAKFGGEAEAREKEHIDKEVIETRREFKAVEGPVKAAYGDLSEFENKLRNLEEKIASLDRLLSNLKKELRNLRMALDEAKKSGTKRKRRIDRLPKPIMSFMDARDLLGDSLHSLIYSGKVIVVGSLVVDSDYYNDFISRFPISRKEAEKLSDQEKLLLEQLKNEGKIYLYAGKEYRLV